MARCEWVLATLTGHKRLQHGYESLRVVGDVSWEQTVIYLCELKVPNCRLLVYLFAVADSHLHSHTSIAVSPSPNGVMDWPLALSQ